MTSLPAVEDLQLVQAVVRTGAVGTAARELRISQPSASQRLARIERLCGVRLFERDTRGARPTAAGAELARRADHILSHLEGVYDATRAAATGHRLVIGTFASLAPILFPVLDVDLDLEQVVDHGRFLVERVAEGTMDAAFIAIAEQMTLPRGTVAAGVPLPGTGKQPLKDRLVAFSTYDRGSEEIQSRLVALGATARRGVTLGTTVAMARRRSHLAVVPRSALATELLPGEQLVAAPFRYRLILSVVTTPTPPKALVRYLPQLRTTLNLS
jgi:DNA-binding transcriptional LysR family regulator